ncbi:hypothetical protein ACQ5SP_10700 [Rhodovulum sp. YNF3179]|uniref:hypothetical protein n=1 Tax=Rhodovulum sp. YNF3179 TaxID=3425127 RepID=UPI003D329FB0
MTLIADFLMMAGALAAAFYCLILSRRLRRLNRLDDGLGAAIAVLSQQVGEMTRALERAETAAGASGDALAAQTERAEAAVARLEVLMAALHDLPDADPAPKPDDAPRAARKPGRKRRGDAGAFASRRHSQMESEDLG